MEINPFVCTKDVVEDPGCGQGKGVLGWGQQRGGLGGPLCACWDLYQIKQNRCGEELGGCRGLGVTAWGLSVAKAVCSPSGCHRHHGKHVVLASV